MLCHRQANPGGPREAATSKHLVDAPKVEDAGFRVLAAAIFARAPRLRSWSRCEAASPSCQKPSKAMKQSKLAPFKSGEIGLQPLCLRLM